MVSTGLHSGGSQFQISLSPTTHLNGRAVVFGRLVEGDDVVKAIEKVRVRVMMDEWIRIWMDGWMFAIQSLLSVESGHKEDMCV
jgi:cyclophilin family peptidyl-prolyl cis-trans isomerase